MAKRLTGSFPAAGAGFLLLLAAAALHGQQDPPHWTCCEHIFLTGSHLGSAGAVLHNVVSLGGQPTQEAVQLILNDLNGAAEEGQNACTSCSQYNNLWRGWSGLPNAAGQIRNMVQTGDIQRAAQAARSMDSWARGLDSIRVDAQYGSKGTCEESYFLIGWHLAWMYHSAAVKDMLLQSGNPNVSPFVQEIDMHSRQLVQVLDQYAVRQDRFCVNINQAPLRQAAVNGLQQQTLAPGVLANSLDAATTSVRTQLREECRFTPAFDANPPDSMAGWCVLRKPAPAIGEPGRKCFEFYLADTRVKDASRMAVIVAEQGTGNPRCFATSYAYRQNWEVEPSQYGGPFFFQPAADYAMTQLSPYQGDAYQCHKPIGTIEPAPVIRPTPRPVFPTPTPTPIAFRVPPPIPTPTPVPTPRPNPCPTAEGDALRKEIDALHANVWKPYYCEPGRPPVRWCNEYASNVAAGLQWHVTYCGLGGRTLATIRRGMACLNGCVMSGRDAPQTQRDACEVPCRDIIFGKR